MLEIIHTDEASTLDEKAHRVVADKNLNFYSERNVIALSAQTI
jgi:hypothetical protein